MMHNPSHAFFFMTETQTQTDAAKQPSKPTVGPSRATTRPPRGLAVLEKLAELYPHLFGATFLPLKRGIFQDLLAAHPDTFERTALKEALGQHTRSTRYLNGVAAGWQRHDLQGQPVEAMAPEHVHQALLEVFRRRHARTGEDLRSKLCERIVKAIEASGLTPTAYAELVRGRDEAANAVLDDALAQAAAQSAKDEAMLRAFEASSRSVEAFAEMYGVELNAAARTLERARKNRALHSGNSGPAAS
jgi:ProP effector